MPPKLGPVTSLAGFLESVGAIRDRWSRTGGLDPWFRGQASATWRLEPSLYRQDFELGAGTDIFEVEEDLRAEFMRRGAQVMEGSPPQGEWAWYFLQQHYGCPTRLLDWTDSALVALFFALNSNAPQNPDVADSAAVWMLDPWWLNRVALRHDSILLSDWDEARRYLPGLYANARRPPPLPVAIDPPHIARRLAVQRSRFTIHGRDKRGLEKAAARPRARLLKIVIEERAIDKVRLDLSTCGITDAVLFPDLEGLARDLVRNLHMRVPPWPE
jgi:hypothetical protein